MLINFKLNAVFKINKIYLLNTKNRKFINVAFDKFYKQKIFY